MYEYHATVTRWLDGDTCEVVVDLGFRIYHRLTIRLAGIDTPEVNSPDPVVRTKAAKARMRVTELCPPDAAVVISTEKPDPRDKYGRFLGWVRCEVNGVPRDLTDVMLAEGLGVPYHGGKR